MSVKNDPSKVINQAKDQGVDLSTSSAPGPNSGATSPAKAVFELVKKSIEKSELGPEQLNDLLRGVTLATSTLDRNLAQPDSATLKSLSLVNNGAPLSPDILTSGALLSHEAWSYSMDEIRRTALSYTVGLTLAQGHAPKTAAGVAAALAFDSEYSPALTAQEMKTTNDIFTAARNAASGELSRRGFDPSHSALLKKEGLSVPANPKDYMFIAA